MQYLKKHPGHSLCYTQSSLWSRKPAAFSHRFLSWLFIIDALDAGGHSRRVTLACHIPGNLSWIYMASLSHQNLQHTEGNNLFSCFYSCANQLLCIISSNPILVNRDVMLGRCGVDVEVEEERQEKIQPRSTPTTQKVWQQIQISKYKSDHLFDIRIYKLRGQWLGTLRFPRMVGGILKHQNSAFSYRVKTLKNHLILLNQANELVFGQRELIHKSYNVRCILGVFCVAMVTVL